MTLPLPAECFLGAEEKEGYAIPPAPPPGAAREVLLAWQNAILKLALNATETANDVNGTRLDVCHRAAPNGASVIIE